MKIRQARAVDLEAGIAHWLAQGGGVEFVTFTVPHRAWARAAFPLLGLMGEIVGPAPLAPTFELVADGWRKGIVAGRAWAGCPEGCEVDHRFGDHLGDRDRWGVEAWCRTVEVTFGAHGWHPHIHALMFTTRPWTARQRALRGARLFDRWAGFVRRETGLSCSRDAFKIVGGALGAGRYITKVQEGDAWKLGMEFTRGDLKTGRVRSVTPFELIGPALDGEAWALRRWWEWEQVTQGRRCMSWSVGGRAVLGLDEAEATDQELAEAEVGGDDVLSIDGASVWPLVAQKPGADAGLLAAVEAGSMTGGLAFLAELRGAPG